MRTENYNYFYRFLQKTSTDTVNFGRVLNEELKAIQECGKDILVRAYLFYEERYFLIISHNINCGAHDYCSHGKFSHIFVD
jgi:hypothetical protein